MKELEYKQDPKRSYVYKAVHEQGGRTFECIIENPAGAEWLWEIHEDGQVIAGGTDRSMLGVSGRHVAEEHLRAVLYGFIDLTGGHHDPQISGS